MDPEKVADIGSEFADLDPATERYAKRFSGPAGEWLLSRQTAALRQLIAPWPQGTVLDVGGGHGQVAKPLRDDGYNVHVLASSDAALGRVTEMDGVQTKIGSLMTLPYADNSFDIVTSFRILAHIGNWQNLVAELCRVARHAVIVDFPISGGANALEPLLFGIKKRVEGDTRRYQTMTHKSVQACMSENGFARTDKIGQFVLPMVVHRKLNQPKISAPLEATLGKLGLARLMGTPVVLCAKASK